MDIILTANAATQAMDTLAKKRALPTALSSAEARAALSAGIRARAVWSARTSHAGYVQALRNAIARLLAGGIDNDYANIRAELREIIVAMGYTPETGFPGDAVLGIPPAEPGSLRDLSSVKRIQFVMDTQISMAKAAAQRARGLSPDVIDSFPFWELLRVETRRVPRGSPESASFGWQKRWLIAGGPILPSGKLVAHKLDPVWDKLGDSRIFDDGMDIPHPPFCFNSGMGWRAVGVSEGRDLMVPDPAVRPPTLTPAKTLPPAVASVNGLDDDIRDELLKVVEAEEVADKPGYIKLQEAIDRDVAAADADYKARANGGGGAGTTP